MKFIDKIPWDHFQTAIIWAGFTVCVGLTLIAVMVLAMARMDKRKTRDHGADFKDNFSINVDKRKL